MTEILTLLIPALLVLLTAYLLLDKLLKNEENVGVSNCSKATMLLLPPSA